MAEATVPGMPDISSILAGNQQALSEKAAAASVPISQHVTQIPDTMLQFKQHQPGQLDHSERVGGGNARAQGIGNAVIGVSNLLSKVKTERDNKKTLQIATATKQLITAQQAVDQAKQALAANPNDAAAKEALQHNQAIMDGVLQDDKTRQAISKGFKIDFTDPKANDTLEHKGVQQGRDMARKSMSYGEQFSAKTPTAMVPNEAAISQYKAALEQEKLHMDTAKLVVQHLGLMARLGTQRDIASLKEMGANAREEARLDQQRAMLDEKIDAAATLQKNKYANEFGLVRARAREARNNALELYKYKESDPAVLAQRARETNLKYSAAVEKASDAVRKIENDMQANAEQIRKDPNAASDYAKMLQTAKDQLASVSAYQSTFQKGMTTMLGDAFGGGNADNNKFNPNSIGTYANGDPTSIANNLTEDDDDTFGIDQ